MDDLSAYKTRLAEYLAAKGIHPAKGKNYHCINPAHADSDPSMTFFVDGPKGDGNYVSCNACDFKGDIFDCCEMLTGQSNFKDQLAEIKNVLGIVAARSTKAVKKQLIKKAEWQPLTIEKARAIYNDKRILELAGNTLKRNDLKISRMDPYKNAEGLVDILAVRFDHADGKDVLTFYFDGRSVKLRGYPILLMNRDKIAANPEAPVMIHEGEKCVAAAEKSLPEFIHTTWNGGGKKIRQIQGLECLKGRNVYLFPDDDQKLDKKTNSLFPAEKQPGLSAMLELKKRLEAL